MKIILQIVCMMREDVMTDKKNKTCKQIIFKFPEIELKTEINNNDVIVKAKLKIEYFKDFYSEDRLGINFKDNQAIINEMKKHVIRDVLKQYNNYLLKMNEIDLELL